MFDLLFCFVAICGAVLIGLGHGQMGDYDVFVRDGVVCAGFVVLCYVLIWLNYKRMKWQVVQLGAVEQNFFCAFVDSLKPKSIGPHACLGHLLILCASFLLVWGLEVNVFFVLVGSLVLAVLGVNMLFVHMWQSSIAQQAQPDKNIQNEKDQNEQELLESSYNDAKVMASEIIRQVQSMLKAQEGRVRMESMLCALGALAGYACQRSLLVDVLDQKDWRSESIRLIRTGDGASFLDGEPLNYYLFRSSHSIWELALAHVKLEEDLPDPDDMVAYTSQMMGTPEFGVPRLPKNHKAPYLPVEYVKMMWPTIFSVIRLICQNPREWAAAFGFAIQKIVDEYQDQLILGTALTIVMESAVPMSRMNLFDYFSDQQLL